MTMETAKIILEQLGGNQFIVMTGAKNFIGREDGLSFKLGRNKTSMNYVTITLTPADLYDLKFERVTLSKKTFETTRKVVAEHFGIYADQLQEIFTDTTGLFTKL